MKADNIGTPSTLLSSQAMSLESQSPGVTFQPSPVQSKGTQNLTIGPDMNTR